MRYSITIALFVVTLVGCIVIVGGRGNKYDLNQMDRETQESTTNRKTGVEIDPNTTVYKEVLMGENGKFDTVSMPIDTTRIKKK